MGEEELIKTLKGHKRISLDTSVLIYHVEGVEPYVKLTTALLDWIGEEDVSLVLSPLIWTEMLTKPLAEGEMETAEKIEEFLMEIPKAIVVFNCNHCIDIISK